MLSRWNCSWACAHAQTIRSLCWPSSDCWLYTHVLIWLVPCIRRCMALTKTYSHYENYVVFLFARKCCCRPQVPLTLAFSGTQMGGDWRRPSESTDMPSVVILCWWAAGWGRSLWVKTPNTNAVLYPRQEMTRLKSIYDSVAEVMNSALGYKILLHLSLESIRSLRLVSEEHLMFSWVTFGLQVNTANKTNCYLGKMYCRIFCTHNTLLYTLLYTPLNNSLI